MPVYGLPSALESSLNSLASVRPPTSWRVSGHGDDITVVLRWTECSSPSSDKTIHYDIDHNPKDRIPDADWRNFHGGVGGYSEAVGSTGPGNGEEEYAATTSMVTSPVSMEKDAFRIRYSRTLPRRHRRSSPVPMIITSSAKLNAQKGPAPPCRTATTAYDDVVDRSSAVSPSSLSGLSSCDRGASHSSDDESTGQVSRGGSTSRSNHGMREGIRAYLNQEIEIDTAEDKPASTANPIPDNNYNSTDANDSNYCSRDTTKQSLDAAQTMSFSPKPASEISRSLSHTENSRSRSCTEYSTASPEARFQERIILSGSESSAKVYEKISRVMETPEVIMEVQGNKVDENAAEASHDTVQLPDLEMACTAERQYQDSKYPERYWDRYDPMNDTEDLINVEIEAESPLDVLSNTL